MSSANVYMQTPYPGFIIGIYETNRKIQNPVRTFSTSNILVNNFPANGGEKAPIGFKILDYFIIYGSTAAMANPPNRARSTPSGVFGHDSLRNKSMFAMNYPAASGGELYPSELSKALDRCLFPVITKPQWAFDSPIKNAIY
jgi:hypothetical protein